MKLSVLLKPLDFLKEVKVELTKVIWPTKLATIKLTILVIISTVIVGFFVVGIDFILAWTLKLVTK